MVFFSLFVQRTHSLYRAPCSIQSFIEFKSWYDSFCTCIKINYFFISIFVSDSLPFRVCVCVTRIRRLLMHDFAPESILSNYLHTSLWMRVCQFHSVLSGKCKQRSMFVKRMNKKYEFFISVEQKKKTLFVCAFCIGSRQRQRCCVKNENTIRIVATVCQIGCSLLCRKSNLHTISLCRRVRLGWQTTLKYRLPHSDTHWRIMCIFQHAFWTCYKNSRTTNTIRSIRGRKFYSMERKRNENAPLSNVLNCMRSLCHRWKCWKSVFYDLNNVHLLSVQEN